MILLDPAPLLEVVPGYVGFHAYLHPINVVGDPVGHIIHRVEVSASPTGKVVNVWVDGVRYVSAVDR